MTLEEFDRLICEYMHRAMRENLEAMKADGISDAQIADAMPIIIEHAEQARIQILDDVAGMLDDEMKPSTMH